MLKRDYDGQNCSIARALEVVGERWTLLIVRDAFLGLRRFDHFQESLGIARNVLTDRLNRLVEEDILEARSAINGDVTIDRCPRRRRPTDSAGWRSCVAHCQPRWLPSPSGYQDPRPTGHWTARW